MKTTAKLVSILSLLAAPLSVAQAQMATQIPPTTAQGHFSNWSIGISTNNQVGVVGQALIRAPAANSGIPSPWTAAAFGVATATHPDYSISALLANWPLSVPSLIPIAFSGTSTGGDVTPRVTANGELIMTGNNWYALTFSVANGSVGRTGSLIELQRGGPNGTRNVAGDLFSFYPAGGSGINPVFADTVRVEYTREQLQIPSTDNISNTDFGIGVISSDPTGGGDPMFPVRNRFYFTLSRRWLNAHTGLTLLGGALPSTANIYSMSWENTGTAYEWTAPVIAYNQKDLFSSVDEALQPTLEIDAISVYRVAASTGSSGEAEQDRVVFSLTRATTGAFNQILVYQRPITTGPTQSQSVACNTTALKVSTGNGPVNVTDKIGLNVNDDPISLCSIDPHRVDPTGPKVFPVVAMALDDNPCGAGQLGLTGIRTSLLNPNFPSTPGSTPTIETLNLQVTGLNVQDVYPLAYVQFFTEGPPLPPGSHQVPAAPVELGSPYFLTPGQTTLNAVNVSWPVSHVVGNPTPTRISARIYGVSFTPNVHVVELRSSWILSLLL